MGWLSNLFRGRDDSLQKSTPSIPDGFSTSGRQYPAAILGNPDIRKMLAHYPRTLIIMATDEKTFRIASPPDDYRKIVPMLRGAAGRLQSRWR